MFPSQSFFQNSSNPLTGAAATLPKNPFGKIQGMSSLRHVFINFYFLPKDLLLRMAATGLTIWSMY